jgi:hypothetical protein
MALAHNLLPGLKSDDFERVLHFLNAFRSVEDEKVNPRYRYGELRLSRVNLIGRLFKFRFFYHDVHGQYSIYFMRYLTPLVFAFATVTVALTAMQVLLAVEQLGSQGLQGGWSWFLGVARWYSVVCMVLVCAALLFFPLLWLGFLVNELTWATCFVMAKARNKTVNRTVRPSV